MPGCQIGRLPDCHSARPPDWRVHSLDPVTNLTNLTNLINLDPSNLHTVRLPDCQIRRLPDCHTHLCETCAFDEPLMDTNILWKSGEYGRRMESRMAGYPSSVTTRMAGSFCFPLGISNVISVHNSFSFLVPWTSLLSNKFVLSLARAYCLHNDATSLAVDLLNSEFSTFQF